MRRSEAAIVHTEMREPLFGGTAKSAATASERLGSIGPPAAVLPPSDLHLPATGGYDNGVDALNNGNAAREKWRRGEKDRFLCCRSPELILCRSREARWRHYFTARHSDFSPQGMQSAIQRFSTTLPRAGGDRPALCPLHHLQTTLITLYLFACHAI